MKKIKVGTRKPVENKGAKFLFTDGLTKAQVEAQARYYQSTFPNSFICKLNDIVVDRVSGGTRIERGWYVWQTTADLELAYKPKMNYRY